jgi:hypothetical protein
MAFFSTFTAYFSVYICNEIHNKNVENTHRFSFIDACSQNIMHLFINSNSLMCGM